MACAGKRKPGPLSQSTEKRQKVEGKAAFYGGLASDTMVLFSGTRCFMSNFHPSAFIGEDGKTAYNCAEQYYQAAKADTFGDAKAKAIIMNSSRPAVQKRAGRSCKGKEALAEWERTKVTVMDRALWLKFSQHPKLAAQLLETGQREIVEASHWCRIWGIGFSENDPRAWDKSQWPVGGNLLGQALVRCRERIGK